MFYQKHSARTLGIAAVTLVAALFSSLGHARLEAGDMAPDFALPGSDGNMHRLADLRGQYVVIAFFPKAFTGG